MFYALMRYDAACVEARGGSFKYEPPHTEVNGYRGMLCATDVKFARYHEHDGSSAQDLVSA